MMEWEKAIEHDLTAPAEARNRVYIRAFDGGSSYFRAAEVREPASGPETAPTAA